ncbi:hypothetical protein [Xylocopilactobacillus apicola]|nr:hypothetical protein [Xylocopilactobacillus apicola]
MDINKLVSRENFYFSDCIFIRNEGLFSYSLAKDMLVIKNEVPIDEDDLTDIFANVTINHNGAVYVAGESATHGS